MSYILYKSEKLLNVVSYLLVTAVKLVLGSPCFFQIATLKLLKIFIRAPKERIQLDIYETGIKNRSPRLALMSSISKEISLRIRKNFCKAFIKQYLKKDWYGTTYEAHPMVMTITPSVDCSANCVGCYASNHPKEEKLSPGIKRLVTKQAQEMHIRAVFISGGEPFEDPDTLPYCLDFPHLVFAVFTNGKTINAKVAAKIRRAGNIIPIIGIDGPEHTNDAIRGKDSFSFSLRAMKHLALQKVFFGICTVAGKMNFAEILSPSFVLQMVESKAKFIWYNLYQPIGREPDFDMMLSPRQRKEMYYRIKSLQEDYPIFLLDLWNSAWVVGGCTGAGKFNFHINNRGDLEPCNVIHFADSNIYREKDLKKALESNFFRAVRKAQPFCENLFCTCLFRDHHDILKKLCDNHGVYPTHDKAADSFIPSNIEQMLKQKEEWSALSQELWGEISRRRQHMVDLLCSKEKRINEESLENI